MPKLVLGLDLGPSSVGWALIADEEGPFNDDTRIRVGVRVFPEGVADPNTGREQPRGQQRRLARGARRVHQRRRQRREMLLSMLQSAGMVPEGREELRKIWKREPYALRAKGLDERLTPAEFARALYHLNQRRGFKSNRKTGKAAEDGKVLKATSDLQRAIETEGCRTLGEYQARQVDGFRHTEPESERVRGRYTLRAMYEHEFELLWAAQARFHVDLLTDALKARAHHAIFDQRPLRFDPDAIGRCELEPEEERCSRGHWLAQQCRMLQEINNLRTLEPTGEERPLSDSERRQLAETLGQKRKMTFSKIRGLLGLLETQQFNLEWASKRKELQGNPVEASLRSKLGKAYTEAPGTAQAAMHDALAECEDDDQLRKRAADACGLTAEQAEKLLAVSVPTGRFAYSLKAIRRLIPHLQAGHLVGEAKSLAGYEEQELAEAMNKLPPVDEVVKHLTNPMVHRALSETRKVVNGIIREYGKPAEVVVELARDLKNSTDRRKEIFFENVKRRKEADGIRDTLREGFGLPNPSRSDVIKYKLWQECGRICPYTGRVIPQTKLFTEEIQVEHILPYSRSLDDSFINKTLCYEDENRRKLNQTPYEAYHADPERYEEVQQRVAALPWPKRRRFAQKEIELDKCISRQLNDTRYITRQVVAYLRVLGCEVRGSKGQMTATLRRYWGLNGLLDGVETPVKTRDDHRHHAIDAAVVALTTRSALQRLSTTRYSPSRPEFPPPWEGFRDDLSAAAATINVSHRPSRALAGALHEETGLGPTDKPGEFVRRVPVEKLTRAMMNKKCIRDDTIRQIVEEACAERGLGNALLTPPLRMPSSGVPIRRVRILTQQKTVVSTRSRDGRMIRGALPGGNHHVEIYESTDAKGGTVWTGGAISRFEAHQRLRRGEPVVQRQAEDGARFVMSLCINDMFLLGCNGRRQLYRVQKASTGPDIWFRLHTAATIDDKAAALRVSSWRKFRELSPEKVTVDPIGKLNPCND